VNLWPFARKSASVAEAARILNADRIEAGRATVRSKARAMRAAAGLPAHPGLEGQLKEKKNV